MLSEILCDLFSCYSVVCVIAAKIISLSDTLRFNGDFYSILIAGI